MRETEFIMATEEKKTPKVAVVLAGSGVYSKIIFLNRNKNKEEIDLNNPYIKKLIEQKKNLQKKVLLERAENKRLEVSLERNIAISNELKREKERYEIDKNLRVEKRRVKK